MKRWKNMKKSILCIILTLLLILTALPMTAFAQDNPVVANGDAGGADDLAGTGAVLNVNYTINANKTVTATWNKISGAASYTLWYKVFDETYNEFVQVGSAVGTQASAPCTYTFDHDFTLDYAFGGKDFKIAVKAYDSSKNVIAEGESSVFQTNVPILDTPKRVELTPNGIASWSPVNHAAHYNVELHMYQRNSVYFKNVTTPYCDVSSKMINGCAYKVFVTACNPGELYRESAPGNGSYVYASNDLAQIEKLKWDGYKLSWMIYPTTDKYVLTLYQLTGTTWKSWETVNTEKTEYDFTKLFGLYGDGTYKVKMAAYNDSYTETYHSPWSLTTESPTIQVSGVTRLYAVRGSYWTFLNNNDPVKLELRQGSFARVIASLETTDHYNVGYYSIRFVPEGVYTMYVSKKNHVTRKYRVSVSGGNKEVDVQLNPLGDINGDGEITPIDFARANSHARGVSLLEGYALSCADVIGDDGEVTPADAARINSAARGVSPLW